MTVAVPGRRVAEDLRSQERPALTLALSSALFAGIFVLRVSIGEPIDAYSMLYVFPVALLATSFGARAGVTGGLIAVTLIAAWAVAEDVGLSLGGWAARIVPLLLLGFLLGEASDRIRRTERERQEAEAAVLLHREAIEINDSIVQGMAAAKWALEAGQVDAGTRVLGETITRAQDLVSDLIHRADMGERAEALPPQRHGGGQ